MDLIKEIFGFGHVFFSKNGKPKFMNENYFVNRHYSFYRSRERIKRKRGNCIYPSCENRCIMSHTIPEAASLKKISNSGKVYYPKYNRNTNEYDICTISTKKASIFPGFCQKHEKLFQQFERDGDFTDESIAFQNLRVVCRDYFLWKALEKVFIASYNEYTNHLTGYHKELIEILNQFKADKIELGSVRDEVCDHMEKCIGTINENIREIQDNDLLPYLRSIQEYSNEISVITVQLPCQVPLCLAGKSSFEVIDSKNNSKNKFTVYLSVLTKADSTIACFSLATMNVENFYLILSKCNDFLSFLSFIESWMIFGTDYWFISPDEWDGYSSIKKQSILHDLAITNCYPTINLKYSIFDDARRIMIAMTKHDVHPEESLLRRISFENEKLHALEDT